MWGLKMERFSTPKVLAVGPNLHNACTLLCDRRSNKQKDVDLVQMCLKYCSAAMYCRHAKEKEKEKEKNQMKLTFRINKSPCWYLQE
jgi:hypothetical protein